MKIQTFFDWWLSQLADWIPPNLKNRFGRVLNRLVIEIDPEHIRVHAEVQGETNEFGKLAFDEIEARRDRLQTFLASLPDQPSVVEVRIPANRYLHREIELPLAAEENLREAIGFQLDRLTPFNPGDVLYNCGIIARDATKKSLRAWLSATPGMSVEKALGLLGTTPPRTVKSDKAPPAEGEPMLLRYTNEYASGKHRIPWALIVLNVALFAGAIAIHLSNRKLEMDTLEAALVEARQQADEAIKLRESAEQLRMEVFTVRDKRMASPLAVAVLNDLTNRLGDDTWLQRFEINDGKLRVYGVAKSASPLIAKLEASPHFADVRFESSVTRDAASDGERFSIMAQLVHPKNGTPAGTES